MEINLINLIERYGDEQEDAQYLKPQVARRDHLPALQRNGDIAHL